MAVVSSFFQNAWKEVTKDEERVFFVVSMMWAITGTFWFMNLVFFLLDRSGIFAKYKIQPHKYPPWPLVKECLTELFVGHVIIRPLLLFYGFPLFVKCGISRVDRPLPSWPVIAAQIMFCIWCNDTAFYWAHRMLHHPSIYKYVHKKHHEFKITVGIAAEYAHPIEQILANSIPTLLGPLLIGCHTYVLLGWLVLRLIETVDAHCGYELPFSPFHLLAKVQGGADRHDFHHSHNIGNFGAFFVFWDWIMGTDKAYLQWRAKEDAAKAKQSLKKSK